MQEIHELLKLPNQTKPVKTNPNQSKPVKICQKQSKTVKTNPNQSKPVKNSQKQSKTVQTTQRAEAGCYPKKKMDGKTLQIQKI